MNGERLEPFSSKKIGSMGRLLWDYVLWRGVPEKKQEQVEQLYRCLREKFDGNASLMSGSLSLAFLSQGAFSAFVDPYRRKEKFVDIAAGLLLAEEVGCIIHRKSLSERVEEIVAAPPEIANTILSDIELYMHQ